MGLIVKIAWRNVLRHKGKSAVIGTILFIGAFLMTVGSGIVAGMEKGLSTNIVKGFTGDVVLAAKEQRSDNLFLEFMGKATEPINCWPAARAVLAGHGYVDQFVPVGKNAAMILNDEGGAPGFAFLLGVEIEQYRRMFPSSFDVVEGTTMAPGEAAVLLPAAARKEYFATTGLWFSPAGMTPDTALMAPQARKLWPNELVVKENMVFMGMNDDNTTTDVQVVVKGVIRYHALNTIWGHFTLMDIESYRRCLGYFAAGDRGAPVSAEQQRLLEMGNADVEALFGTDAAESQVQAPPGVAPGGAAAPATAGLESGAYNLVLVLLKGGMKPEEGARRLSAAMDSAGVPLRAVPWRTATGTIGSMSRIIRGALFMFVMMLFVVAIIVIVNTLSMAALERVTEIGMMRAVGARKGFISLMFLGETATLSFVFGGIGVAAGIIAVQIVPLLHITSANDIVQLLFGGDTLRPFLAPRDIVLVAIQLAFVTVLAVLYPLKIARGITPLDAIARE